VIPGPFTFDEIPPQVKHWYMVNNSIEDDRLTTIPFGIPEGREHYFDDLKIPEVKQDKIYVNWSDNTLERVLLKEKLKKEKYIYLREEPIPYEDFLAEMAQYKYVLCPPGNGLDSYRILEALYCGCWPIVESNKHSSLIDLPSYVEPLEDLDRCDIHDSLADCVKRSNYLQKQFEKTKLSYWKQRIYEKKKELL
jgi:hypothetical protein